MAYAELEISPSTDGAGKEGAFGWFAAALAGLGSLNVREPSCRSADSRTRRRLMSSITSSRGVGPGPLLGWSGSVPTRSPGSYEKQALMPKASTRNAARMKWWPFPPLTREVQFDENWSFVEQKDAHDAPAEPQDERSGSQWNHVAFDPEHRLVLVARPGKRTRENTEAVVAETAKRTQGREDLLLTSDDHKPYRGAIKKAFSKEVPQQRRFKRGRPPGPSRPRPRADSPRGVVLRGSDQEAAEEPGG